MRCQLFIAARGRSGGCKRRFVRSIGNRNYRRRRALQPFGLYVTFEIVLRIRRYRHQLRNATPSMFERTWKKTLRL